MVILLLRRQKLQQDIKDAGGCQLHHNLLRVLTAYLENRQKIADSSVGKRLLSTALIGANNCLR